MVDSDDSEIDVCTVDDEEESAVNKNITEATRSSQHSGLTLVAAELFIQDKNAVKGEDQIVPLTSDDLLKKPNAKETKETVKKEVIKMTDANHSKDTLSKDEGNLKDEKVATNPLQQDDVITKSNELCENENEDLGGTDSEEELFDSGEKNMLNRFSFESDHMALKNNTDYQTLLKTLAILEAQQAQAIKDLEELHRLKTEALSDPLKFVKKLQDRNGNQFPERQNIAKIPVINWQHYMTAYSGDKFAPQVTTRKTLKDQQIQDDPFGDEMEDIENLDDNDASQFCDNSNKGKNRSDDKPSTFNQKWTVEEQEKLEKLLILFPPEEVEARRWEKIAKALGNRTPQQVSSRIQKYFAKLAKAKLPIPGRVPSGLTIQTAKRTRLNPLNYKNSTFFPSWRPTVSMQDDDNDMTENWYERKYKEYFQPDNEDNISDDLKDSLEYQELMELKQLRKALHEKASQSEKPVHTGFMCDGCKMSPITGIRWHCKDCIQSVDFCNSCCQMGITTDTHLSSHNVTPIEETSDSAMVDGDYVSFQQRNKFKYNYLDPNFQPSSKIT